MHSRLWVAFLCGSAVATIAGAADSGVQQGVAERMTREAIAAGAAGDLELRNDLLQRALHLAPDFAPAHWASGELEIDGKWKPIGEAQLEAQNSEVVAQYRDHAAMIGDTPAEHLELARWCAKNKLTIEARYHWLKVVAADPSNREALKALDAEWVDGKLVTTDQAEAIREQQQQFKKQQKHWRTRITGWQRDTAGGGNDETARVLAEVEAEVDESAIPEFERLANTLGNASQQDHTQTVQLCESYLRALHRLPSFEATGSLLRFAVLANDEALRSQATEELKERPAYEYVPLLVGALSSKLESNFSFSTSPQGLLSYEHQVVEKTPEGERVAELARVGGAVASFGERQSMRSVADGQARTRAAAAGVAQRYLSEAAQIEWQVTIANLQREALNQRIIGVLTATTGKSLGDDPNVWREDWLDENGVELGMDEKPRVTRYTSTDVQYIYTPSQWSQLPPTNGPPSGTTEIYKRVPTPRPEPPRLPFAGAGSECFAAGTLVWTRTGMQAIESLHPGDLVLTMDEQTGERCFRPVLQPTHRDPEPLVRLATSNYELLCTSGHPFWVEGVGWQMAKQLAKGDRIATAEGAPLEVLSIVDADVEQEAFNLIVEGNSNYFVGKDGLLSHDNTRRRPELARAGEQ